MGETGPHYLLCNAQDMITKGLGTMLKMNPPVREADHGVVLWEGLLDGTIETIGTDHSPHTAEEKMDDDRFSDIWKAIPGWPGVETNVPLMLTAVNEGKLSLNLYVERQSEGPAQSLEHVASQGESERRGRRRCHHRGYEQRSDRRQEQVAQQAENHALSWMEGKRDAGLHDHPRERGGQRWGDRGRTHW